MHKSQPTTGSYNVALRKYLGWNNWTD